MLPRKVLKLRTSESARNVYFSIYFLHLQSFEGGQPSYMERGTLSKTLRSEGSLCPQVPTSISLYSKGRYLIINILLGGIIINIVT